MKPTRAFALFAVLAICAGSPPARAQSECQSIKGFETAIEVNLLQPDVVHDLTKKRDYMRRFLSRDLTRWLQAERLELLWHADDLALAGFAAGAWDVAFDFDYDMRGVDVYGAYYCPYVRSVTVDILYRPVIFIPAETPKGSCGFGVMNAHEMKHAAAAGEALAAFPEQLRAGLSAVVARLEARPYMGKAQLKPAFAEMEGELKAAVKTYYGDALKKEMAARAEAVDTPEEIAALEAALESCVPEKKNGFRIFGN